MGRKAATIFMVSDESLDSSKTVPFFLALPLDAIAPHECFFVRDLVGSDFEK